MSQNFVETFVPTDQGQDTMQQVVEWNDKAIQTNFSGSSSVAVGVREACQWWADTANHILKLRNEADGAWLEIYDIGNEQVFLALQQVDDVHIKDTARKGSIVTGEAIVPASCTLQGKGAFRNISLPHAANELFPLSQTPQVHIGFGVLPTLNWQPLYTSQIYVTAYEGTLYVMALQETCSIRFTIGSTTSSANTPVTGALAWSDEAFLDTVGITEGWYDFVVEGLSTAGPTIWGGIGGIASRWEV